MSPVLLSSSGFTPAPKLPARLEVCSNEIPTFKGPEPMVMPPSITDGFAIDAVAFFFSEPNVPPTSAEIVKPETVPLHDRAPEKMSRICVALPRQLGPAPVQYELNAVAT